MRPPGRACSELLRRLEVVQFQAGAAQLPGRVRVGAQSGRLASRCAQVAGALVVARQDVAAVEALDRVDRGLDALQRCGRDHGATEDVEGMRDYGEAALLVDGADGVLGRDVARHELLQEEADESRPRPS